MLFETARRLQLNPRQLELYYDQIKINVTETYTYLGSTLDPHLNFGDNFDEKYNNASYKLRVLYNIIHLLSTKSNTSSIENIMEKHTVYLFESVYMEYLVTHSTNTLNTFNHHNKST